MVAHIEAVAVAHGDGLEAGGVDLQHRDIIVLIGAHHGGVISLAGVQRHLHGGGSVDDVMVGDDIAVLRQDEAGTGGGVLHRLAEVVGGGGAVDGDHAVDVGGVVLRVGHLGLAVHGHLLDLHRLPLADLDLSGISVTAGCPHDAGTGGTAQQGAAQSQSGHLQSSLVFLAALLLGLLPGLPVGGLHHGRLGRLGLLCAIFTIIIMIQILLVVIHIESSLRTRFSPESVGKGALPFRIALRSLPNL